MLLLRARAVSADAVSGEQQRRSGRHDEAAATVPEARAARSAAAASAVGRMAILANRQSHLRSRTATMCALSQTKNAIEIRQFMGAAALTEPAFAALLSFLAAHFHEPANSGRFCAALPPLQPQHNSRSSLASRSISSAIQRRSRANAHFANPPSLKLLQANLFCRSLARALPPPATITVKTH